MLNVGWLQNDHEFEVEKPTKEFLDKLWDCCSICVLASRGRHYCDLCGEQDVTICERNGRGMVFGRSQIWLLSGGGDVLAAPDLIYHYVEKHNYRPPDDFVDAVIARHKSSINDYLDRLSAIGMKWGATDSDELWRDLK